MNDIKPIEEKSVVSSDNKKAWLNKIFVKQIQGKKLDAEDYCFLQNMSLSDDNVDYANTIKTNLNWLSARANDMEDLDPEVWFAIQQRNEHLKITMYKAQAQARRDDSTTRKNDLSTVNKYMKLAKEKGYEFNPEELGITPVHIVNEDEDES